MAKFGEFKYGGTTPEQEKLLATMRKTGRKQMARDIGRTESRFASKGLGRMGQAQTQLAGIAQDYGSKIAQQEGQARTSAQREAYDRWFGKRSQEFGAEESARDREFTAGESAKGRTFEGTQAEKERKAAMGRLKESKKKSTWDYIREGAGAVGSLFP